jgi:hypothetical protein
MVSIAPSKQAAQQAVRAQDEVANTDNAIPKFHSFIAHDFNPTIAISAHIYAVSSLSFQAHEHPLGDHSRQRL